MKRLIVTGAYPSGAGYPNVTNTLERLTADGEIDIEFAGDDLGANRRLWREASGGVVARLLHITGLAWRNVCSVTMALRKARKRPDSFLYVPHPPLPAMLMLSLVPRRWRPCCLADSYVCVWDAVVRDRGLLREAGIPARLLRRIEARALSAADYVVVDTEANAHMMSQQLGLSRDQLVSLPLAINEKIYQRAPYASSTERPCRVLFVGTLVPLHGIEEIVGALRELEGVSGLEFVLIGDGQQADILNAYIASGPALSVCWERRWMDEGKINQAIVDADICLGIFGGSGKASRVMPFKLYSYFRVGRAVISQRAFGTPADTEEVPFFPVDAPVGSALAAAIRYLAENPLERVALAERGASYYQRYLGSEPFMRGWNDIIERSMPR